MPQPREPGYIFFRLSSLSRPVQLDGSVSSYAIADVALGTLKCASSLTITKQKYCRESFLFNSLFKSLTSHLFLHLEIAAREIIPQSHYINSAYGIQIKMSELVKTNGTKPYKSGLPPKTSFYFKAEHDTQKTSGNKNFL